MPLFCTISFSRGVVVRVVELQSTNGGKYIRQLIANVSRIILEPKSDQQPPAFRQHGAVVKTQQKLPPSTKHFFDDFPPHGICDSIIFHGIRSSGSSPAFPQPKF